MQQQQRRQQYAKMISTTKQIERLSWSFILILVVPNNHCVAMQSGDSFGTHILDTPIVDVDQLLHDQLYNINVALQQNDIWLAKLNNRNHQHMSTLTKIEWKYEVRDIIKFVKQIKDNLRGNFTLYPDPTASRDIFHRQYDIITRCDYNSLPLNETFLLYDILQENNVEKNFCSYTNRQNCTLNGKHLFDIFVQSSSPDELQFYFAECMNKYGRNQLARYETFLQYYNKAAKLNGFRDSNDMQKFAYALDKQPDNHEWDLDLILKSIMDEIKPFHMQLHAYIRHRLQQQFNKRNYSLIADNGPIPDYLHQKLIAYSYAENLQLLKLPATATTKCRTKFSQPFRNHSSLSVDVVLQHIKSWYQGVGFEVNKIPLSLSVNDVYSHARFDDALGRKDLRLKVGTNVTENQLSELFVEFFKYLEFTYGYDQPYVLRKLYPKALGSAIANALRHSIEDFSKVDQFSNAELNRFVVRALQTILSFQSKYVTSQTMRCLQTTPPDQHRRCEFWSQKLEWQGITTSRNNSDADVLAWKLNAWNDDDYGDMISIILGFQIFEGLCEQQIDGRQSTRAHLAHCDLTGRKNVGAAIKKILSEGSSVSWDIQLKSLLPSDQRDNQSILTAKSMLRYFKPLHEWLEKYNKENMIAVGW